MKKIILLLLIFPLFTYAKENMAQWLITQTNIIRVKKGIEPLVESSFLDKIAKEECTYRATHKFNLKYFMYHNRPWLTFQQRYENWFSGFYMIFGENQAWMPSESLKYATKEFWNSLPHRENLLDTDYKNMWTSIVGRFVCESFSS